MKKIMKFGLIFVGVLILIGVVGAALGLGESEVKEQPKASEVTTFDWVDEINAIANSSDSNSDKFYALEKVMLAYETNENEVTQFESEIVSDYKNGTYLNELDNHERMLSNIFKSYVVEQNTNGSIKDFAFDYHQNLKYVYRGADTPDSESVKSNEEQMNKALASLNK